MSQPTKRALARCQTVPFEGLAQAEPAPHKRVVANTVPFEQPASSERTVSSMRPKIIEVPILGRVIGDRYTIEELIGEGPTGSVYRARQRTLDKPVAVKVLNAQHAAQPGCVERLHRAARAASQLDHPAIAHVVDYGHEPDGLLYVVMEYVEGRDLRTLLEDERLDQTRAVNILREVLAALAVAHDRHLVHGNLKPENILVWSGVSEDGELTDCVKVTDFGLFAGSPEHNSPEQFRGAVLEPRSDLYSVGVLFYQMLTGEKPFVGESAVAVAMQHAADPVFPPSQLAEVPEALERVCLRALEKQPRDRFASARDMRRALRDALSGPIDGPSVDSERPAASDLHDVPVLTLTKRRRVPKRSVWPAFVAFAALAAAIALVVAKQPTLLTTMKQHALGLEVPGAAAAALSPQPKTTAKKALEPTSTPVPRPKYTSASGAR